jgi:hypothetical protein
MLIYTDERGVLSSCMRDSSISDDHIAMVCRYVARSDMYDVPPIHQSPAEMIVMIVIAAGLSPKPPRLLRHMDQ